MNKPIPARNPFPVFLLPLNNPPAWPALCQGYPTVISGYYSNNICANCSLYFATQEWITIFISAAWLWLPANYIRRKTNFCSTCFIRCPITAGLKILHFDGITIQRLLTISLHLSQPGSSDRSSEQPFSSAWYRRPQLLNMIKRVPSKGRPIFQQQLSARTWSFAPYKYDGYSISHGRRINMVVGLQSIE